MSKGCHYFSLSCEAEHGFGVDGLGLNLNSVPFLLYFCASHCSFLSLSFPGYGDTATGQRDARQVT
jgi:hypothetical protein